MIQYGQTFDKKAQHNPLSYLCVTLVPDAETGADLLSCRPDIKALVRACEPLFILNYTV